MEDIDMRKTHRNLTPAEKFGKIDVNVYETYQIRVINTYPDGSEKIRTHEVKVKRGMNSLKLQELYEKLLKSFKVTESFIGEDRIWFSTEGGYHSDIYMKKVA